MRFTVRSSPIHGRGLFARTHLAPGERLLEYKGERISSAQAHARYGDNAGTGHTFLFAPNAHFLIDAERGGSSARYINHSCEPNCEAVIFVNINGDEERDRVFIYALREIEAEQELSIDYAIELASDQALAHIERWACACGASACRGSMLAP